MERDDVVRKAQAFVDEYKRLGFFRYADSPAAEKEAVEGVVQRVLEDNAWAPDWFLIGGDERNIYWFDTEWLGDLGTMYAEFLGALTTLSGGELQFRNVEEHVDFEDSSEAWVQFDWLGGRHHIVLGPGGDYIDFPSVVRYLNGVLAKAGNPHRLVVPYDTGDQTTVLAYLAEESIRRLQTSKGWSIQPV